MRSTAFQLTLHEYAHAYEKVFGVPLHIGDPPDYKGGPYNTPCGHANLSHDSSKKACENLTEADPPATEEEKKKACDAHKALQNKANTEGQADWKAKGCDKDENGNPVPFPAVEDCQACENVP